MFTHISSQADIQVAGGVNSEPEHQNSHGNGKHNQTRQTLLKPNKDEADEGCQER